jgi:SAM-dependent methyltransferase
MPMIKRLIESLREKGVFGTLKSAARILADYRFDWKYGTDTMRRVEVDSFETGSAYKTHATPYQASKTRPLLKLLRELRLPKEGVFVDLGCGKGRVLFIAAQLGFKKIIGIEFCARLCRQARENAELYLRKHPARSLIEVIEMDAARYDFRGDENIFFLYNPFDSVVLEQVLDKIALSALKTPRDIWLIYNNPAEHETIQRHRLFSYFLRYEIEGEIFHVYEHRVMSKAGELKKES